MEGNLSWRHALALFVTLSSAWLIWNGTHLVLTEPQKLPPTPLIHISLSRPPAPPAPPKVVPKPPKPPKPIITKKIATRTPIETSPHAIGPPITSNAPVSSQNAAPSIPAPPAPAAPAENVSLQLAYEASVNAAIQERKRYPTSKDAMLQHPSGTVVLWITLNRAGELVDAVIDQSGGSILDRAALETVHRASYPPFPPSIWPGDSKARLRVSINFTP